jgi:hypothetical protein
MRRVSINGLKTTAVNALMDETFTHIRNAQHRAYVELAEKNSDLRVTTATFFMYGGITYPKKSVNGTPVSANINCPPLHYTLAQKLEETNAMPEDAGWTRMRNYFIAILDASANGLVLKAFLPEVLIGRLKKDFGELTFNRIDVGIAETWYSPEVTEEMIANIKEHYTDMAPALRELLMDKLLLQD